MRKSRSRAAFQSRLLLYQLVVQNMGGGARHGLEGADQILHEIDLTLEQHACTLTDRALAIQPRSQRAAPLQQQIQALNEAVSGDLFPCRRRIVPPQSCHLAAFRLGTGVIPDQIASHFRYGGSPPSLGAGCLLTE